MKKSIILILFLSSILACKSNKETTETTETQVTQAEPEPEEYIARKFEDTEGCSYYANIFEAIPHLDTYKEQGFGKVECLINKEKTGMPPNITVSYVDRKTNNNFKMQVTEISGEFAKEELNNLKLAKTSYNEVTKVAGSNTFKSSLTVFDNISAKIEESQTPGEKSSATYFGTFKDKYVFAITIEMDGKIDLATADKYIKEYLEGINKEALK
jgi:hypothetical protein